MRGFFGYFAIGTVATVAMALVTVVGLGLSVGARPLVGNGALVQHVDRTHKGDRLDMRMTTGAAPQPKATQSTPVGCEPEFSPLAAGSPATSGRCDS